MREDTILGPLLLHNERGYPRVEAKGRELRGASTADAKVQAEVEGNYVHLFGWGDWCTGLDRNQIANY